MYLEGRACTAREGAAGAACCPVDAADGGWAAGGALGGGCAAGGCDPSRVAAVSSGQKRSERKKSL